MTREQLVSNLGTIARSGKRQPMYFFTLSAATWLPLFTPVSGLRCIFAVIARSGKRAAPRLCACLMSVVCWRLP